MSNSKCATIERLVLLVANTYTINYKYYNFSDESIEVVFDKITRHLSMYNQHNKLIAELVSIFQYTMYYIVLYINA